MRNEIVFSPSDGGYMISNAMPKINAIGNRNFAFIRMLINTKYAIKKLGMIEDKAK